MPRYLIERTSARSVSAYACSPGGGGDELVRNNSREGVTWIQSFITPDRRRSWCLYEAPSPEAIRSVADRNGLPVDRICEVHALDPYPLP